MLADLSMVQIVNSSVSQDEAFIFDGVTGKFFSVDKSLSGWLQKAICTCENGKNLHGQGIKRIQWPMSFQAYRTKLDSDLETLVLQLTRHCNLACSYCVYSGHYGHMLPHKKEDMSYEVLEKSIDYFLSHSCSRKVRSIVFYGGEAMLCFDHIKWAVEYVHHRNPERNIQFSISTNGVKLCLEQAEWLSHNEDVSVVVTLNGYKHDVYRVLPNGIGSLNIIYANIENIRQRYPRVWNSQMGFIANINDEDELDELEGFYRAIDKFPALITKIGISHGDTYISEWVRTSENLDNIRKKWLRRYVECDSPALKAYFDTTFYEIHNRYISEDCIAIIRGCLPMEVSLFVRTDGSFNMCTRVTDYLELGNVYNGYNEDKLRYLYDGMLLFANENCRTCWAQRVCGYCFQDFLDENGIFYTKLSQGMCKKMRNNTFTTLSAYCDIVLSQPDRVKDWSELNQEKHF